MNASANPQALADACCVRCSGTGVRLAWKRGKDCQCAFRALFRACLRRYRACVSYPDQQPYFSHKRGSGFKSAEYAADFELTAKRALAGRIERDVFRLHMLLRGDWRLCCQKLRIDRGTFWHLVYRIEERLGRAFDAMAPYGLFPRDYFAERAFPWSSLPRPRWSGDDNGRGSSSGYHRKSLMEFREKEDEFVGAVRFGPRKLRFGTEARILGSAA
jgi:hypothetical protein